MKRHELWNKVNKKLLKKNLVLGIKDSYIMKSKYSHYSRESVEKAARKRMFSRAYYPKYILLGIKKLKRRDGKPRRLILSLQEAFGKIDFVALDVPHRNLIHYAFPNYDYYSQEEWTDWCKRHGGTDQLLYYPEPYEEKQFENSRIKDCSIKFNLKAHEVDL